MTTTKTKIQKAIKWVASEYSELEKLHQLIEKEEELYKKKFDDIKLKNKGKKAVAIRQFQDLNKEHNLNKAKHVAFWLGRAEKNAEMPIKDILEVLGKVNDRELKKALEKVKVPSGFLVKESSWYVGSLKKGLNALKRSVKSDQKYPSNSKKVAIQKQLQDMDVEVKQLETWATSLEGGLEHLSEVVRKKRLGRGKGGKIRRLVTAAGVAIGITASPGKTLPSPSKPVPVKVEGNYQATVIQDNAIGNLKSQKDFLRQFALQPILPGKAVAKLTKRKDSFYAQGFGNSPRLL